MKQERISSITTIWFAWILPICILGFWTPFTIIVLFSNFSSALSVYLLIATSIIWIIYIITKPWKFKKVNVNDFGLIIKSSKNYTQIPFKNVKSIESLFSIKLSPVTIVYLEKNRLEKVLYISRFSFPFFTLPFEENPAIQLIKDEVIDAYDNDFKHETINN